jgi:hypothetical protein
LDRLSRHLGAVRSKADHGHGGREKRDDKRRNETDQAKHD